MIKIEMEVKYDRPLNEMEKARIAEAIRRILQPTVAQAACTQRRDALPPGFDPEFIRSQFLDITTKIEVVA